jgi:hypothetical protein
MKKLLIALILGISFTAFGQFKGSGFPTESVMDGIVRQGPSIPLLGFLNSGNFEMHQSVEMSYSTFGSQGLALGVYTNSLLYRFNNKLNVQADISIVNSPYSSFGKSFQNRLNGIYLSNAEINYRPWKDVFITLQYRNSPLSYYSPYGYYYNGFNSFFNEPSLER